MPYAQLSMPDNNASAIISIATEHYLEQAHYLLAATHSNGEPANHFGMSAAIMTLLSIAAASSIRHFIPSKNKNDKGDKAAFVECVSDYFPWESVTIKDDQHRPNSELPKIAAEELYHVIRNPLVHSGGVTSKPHLSGKVGDFIRAPKISHIFPGLALPHDNEKVVADYCDKDINGEVLIELEACCAIVHTRTLYWCARKMIEKLRADAKSAHGCCTAASNQLNE